MKSIHVCRVAIPFLLLMLGSCISDEKGKSSDKRPTRTTLVIDSKNLKVVEGRDTMLGKELSKEQILVCYLDASCSFCASSLLVWREFLGSLNSIQHLGCVFIMYGPSIDYAQQALDEVGKFGYLACYTVGNKFGKDNHLIGRYNTRSFLVDKHGNIYLEGNPMVYQELFDSFKKAIEAK
jgi:hypothetical protein